MRIFIVISIFIVLLIGVSFSQYEDKLIVGFVLFDSLISVLSLLLAFYLVKKITKQNEEKRKNPNS